MAACGFKETYSTVVGSMLHLFQEEKILNSKSNILEKHVVDSKLDLVAPRLRVHSPMLEALVKGNVRHVELMLKVGSDPNQMDAMRRTPLIILSYYRDERKAAKLATYIISLGGKIDYADINGMNALHHACHKNKAVFAAILLKYRDNYNVFATDNRGKMCFDYLHGDQSHNLLIMLKSIAVEYGLDPTVFQIKVPFRQSCREQMPTTHKTGYMQKEKHSLRDCFNHKTDGITETMIPSEIHGNHGNGGAFEQTKVIRMKVQQETPNKESNHCFYTGSKNCRQSLNDKRTKGAQVLDKEAVKLKKACFKAKDSLPNPRNERDNKHCLNHREQAEEISKPKKPTIDNVGCKPGSKSAKSSKEHLIRILKIYEMQNSVLYREGAKEHPVEEKLDKTSNAHSPNNLPEEEIKLAVSGRTSRSMSLLLGSIPSMIKKRRPSRVSLQSNKLLKSKFTDTSNVLNSTRQRRFSNVSSSKYSYQSISPEGVVSLNSCSVLSLSAPNISVIKRANAERKNNNVDALMTNYAIHLDRKVNFKSTEVSTGKCRNIQKKISSLPALNVFMEIGEQSEIAEQ